MGVPLLHTETRWECPNCPAQHVTTVADPHQPFHNCPGLHGMYAPYVREGTRCKVETVEREDYVGAEQGLTYVEGRPVMSVVTTREDGQDCAVFPGCATGSVKRG